MLGEGHVREKKVKLASVSAPCQLLHVTPFYLRETSSKIYKSITSYSPHYSVSLGKKIYYSRIGVLDK